MTPGALWRAGCMLAMFLAQLVPAHAGGVSVSPTSLSFGNQVVSTSSVAKSVTVTNGLSRALTITSITVTTSDYTQTNTCPLSPSTLAAGASCTISVTFTPTTTGSRSAALSVNDDAAKSPQIVSLAGNGIAAVTATPSNLSYGIKLQARKALLEASRSRTIKPPV